MPEIHAQSAAAPPPPLAGGMSPTQRADLREKATLAARSCSWLSSKRRSSRPREIYASLRRRLSSLESELYRLRSDEPSADLRWLYDNFRLIRTDLEAIHDSLRPLSRLPAVRTDQEESIPRVIVLARSLLTGAQNRLNESVFSEFVS